MDIIGYIKRDRELTLNHWRYKLLHWTFGVNPKSLSEAKTYFPSFLYSHYCPLFHFTNLLAIFFPLIIIIKLVISCVHKTVWLISYICSAIREVCEIFDASYETSRIEAIENMSQEEMEKNINREKRKLYKMVSSHSLDYARDKRLDFRFIYNLDLFEDCLIEVENEYRAKLKEKEERRKMSAEKFAFWIRFSELFVKGLTGVVIAFGCVILGCYLWVIVPPICSWIYWLGSFIVSSILTISFLSVLSIFLNAIWMLLVFAFCLFIGFFIVAACNEFFRTPIEIAGEFILDIIESCCERGNTAIDFLQALYSDNCPPIKIKED